MCNKDIITIATVNFKVISGNKEKNLSRIIGYMEAASKQGVDLILFPELCILGYDIYIDDNTSREDVINMTETLYGNTNVEIAEAAKRLNLYCVYGTAEKDEKTNEIYNVAIATGPEGIIGAYRKIHPFEKENNWCMKGTEPFMFDTKWGPIAVGICYDTYQFPELQRYYASKGSRLYLNPTALKEFVEKPNSRELFLRYYLPLTEYGVLSNTIFIASANLLGYDKFNYFGGASGILGPLQNDHEDTDVTWYAGGGDNLTPGLSIATVDLTLATRNIFIEDKYTGESDYRKDVYDRFK